MFDSCRAKQEKMKKLFAAASTLEEKYQVILDLGRQQTALAPEDRIERNRVRGCQGLTFLKTTLNDGKITFQTESDALISSGLGQLLTMVYSGEEPETILKCPPTYLEELGIYASLSPGRANGLASIFQKMQQEALVHYRLLSEN